MDANQGELQQSHINAPGLPSWRFRIVHLLYVIAVIASSLATMGVGGLVPALVIVGFWSFVFNSRSRPKALRTAVVVLLLFCCVIPCLMLPAVRSAREAARRVQCHNNLKNISLALQNYHDTYRTFPPAYVPDEGGKPMHSWRVLILPFIEQRNLYGKYDFAEPWNGPNNSKLLTDMPEVYACPAEAGQKAAAKYMTSYVAVVDPLTVWPGPTGSTIEQISEGDGTANTIALIEVCDTGIPWMKPNDLGLDEAVAAMGSATTGATGCHEYEDFFYAYWSGFNVAMVDGSAHFFRGKIAPSYLRGLLVMNDESGWDEEADWGDPQAKRRPKLDNWFRLALFLLILVFPTPWVWLNPTPLGAAKVPPPDGSEPGERAE